MYYSTQTNVPGAPGNLAPFTPAAPAAPSWNTPTQVVVPTPSQPVISYYPGHTAVGNMAGLQNAGVVR